jgi:mycobactin lysine-N-oxygenase
LQERSQVRLGILGAGPKGLALAAKARVLEEMGFKVPRIVIFEKNRVANHWRDTSGLTNGQLPLGTPPDKDVGYPYYSFSWGDVTNRKIDLEMLRYSWQNYLVTTHEYSEWIDRGRPSPTHGQWAAYLEWVYHQLERHVELVEAEVKEVDAVDQRWVVRVETRSGEKSEHQVDGLVLTGPGDVKMPVDIAPHPRILTVTDFWLRFAKKPQMEGRSAAVIGSGETAATIAAALGDANPALGVDIVSPHAMTFSRGESYSENHVYTDPFQANWLQLTKQDRRNFVNRTDRGVFSVAVKQELDHLRNVEIVPGHFTGVTVDSLGQLLAHIDYANDRETRIYDYLIVSIGFDHIGFLRRLLTPGARDLLRTHLQAPEINHEVVEESIDRFLAVGDFRPYLHLPMLAGLNQGPGFPNLSSLGRLSDHILACYVPVESVAHVEHPFVMGADDYLSHEGS